jgi:hypothetical protein
MKIFDANISGSLNVSASAHIFGDLTVDGVINATISGTTSNAISSSFATNANLLDGKDSTEFAITGSNTFKANQTITGSLYVTGDVVINGTSYNAASSGSSGTSGSNGSSGTSGSNGSSGTSGSSGSSGSSGTSGSSGSNGSSGTSGSSGSSGSSGTSGSSGSSGTSGSSGSSGSSGTSVSVSGTSNVLVKFTSTSTVGNSTITDDGTTVTIGGNLTVNGTTTTVNSNTVNIGDNIIILNSDETSTPSQNAGIEVERGTSTNASLIWDETADVWEAGLAGAEVEIVTVSGGQTLTNKTINASQLVDSSVTNAKLANSSVTVTAGTGMSGGGAVALGSSVTLTNAGVTSAVAGTGVGVSAGTGAVTISIGQAVATSSNVQFNALGVGTAAGATAGLIRATNDVIAYFSSDERLKENFEVITNPLEKLQQINGYSFDWVPMEGIHENEGHDIGVKAQEIEVVLPELVTTRENGYKAVKYDKLVALLIETNKELLNRIEALEAKIK